MIVLVLITASFVAPPGNIPPHHPALLLPKNTPQKNNVPQTETTAMSSLAPIVIPRPADNSTLDGQESVNASSKAQAIKVDLVPAYIPHKARKFHQPTTTPE